MTLSIPRSRIWMPVTLLALTVVVFVAGLLYSRPSTAAPGISWSPGSINVEIAVGQVLSVSTSFTATENLQGVTLRAVPEISPFVQVSPQSIANVTRGQSVPVTLTLSAPSTTPLGTKSGTVHVVIGTATIAKPLPVNVTYRGNLPPDPGDAGKITLEGIDSDRDGVRDDIQRYIGFTYSSSEKTRLALTGIARPFEQGLLAAAQNDSIAVVQWSTATAGAIDCLWYVLGTNAQAVRRSLVSEYLNTKERSVTYVLYNQLLAGKTFPGRKPEDFKAGCVTFNPDSLPN